MPGFRQRKEIRTIHAYITGGMTYHVLGVCAENFEVAGKVMNFPHEEIL